MQFSRAEAALEADLLVRFGVLKVPALFSGLRLDLKLTAVHPCIVGRRRGEAAAAGVYEQVPRPVGVEVGRLFVCAGQSPQRLFEPIAGGLSRCVWCGCAF